MKAIVGGKYGYPEDLRLEEIDAPTPGDDEVLVKVAAVSLNASDWELVRGRPVYVRVFGLWKPRIRIPGSDVAGRVEAVGRRVTQFRPGDEIFADTMYCGMGGFAEYVCIPETAPIVRKPAARTFEEVASLPQGGGLALQGLRYRGPTEPGHKVLINGAGGSGGTFAIQIARSLGAEVTGVDRTEKLELMRSLGADHVVDFTCADFSRQGRRYDRILDFAGHRSVFAYRRALAPDGIYAMTGGSMSSLLQVLLLGWCFSKTGRQQIGVLAHQQNREDLGELLDLVESGKVAPVIERHRGLREVPAAIRRLGEGQAHGKVVITP